MSLNGLSVLPSWNYFLCTTIVIFSSQDEAHTDCPRWASCPHFRLSSGSSLLVTTGTWRWYVIVFDPMCLLWPTIAARPSIAALLVHFDVLPNLFYHLLIFWPSHFTIIVRGPCPMLNTLANHGILPHSGKNLTQDITVKALIDGVNFTPDLGTFLFGFAITTNPDRNATSFNLHQLGTHGILEHDASLRLFKATVSMITKLIQGDF